MSLFAAASNQVDGSAIIWGTLNPVKTCTHEKAQVWLSQNDVLIYQIEVPALGDFELRALPGSYSIVANTQSGCSVEKKLLLKPNQRLALTLKIHEPSRRPNTERRFRSAKK